MESQGAKVAAPLERSRRHTTIVHCLDDIAARDNSSWIHAAPINYNWIARAQHWPKHPVATSVESE